MSDASRLRAALKPLVQRQQEIAQLRQFAEDCFRQWERLENENEAEEMWQIARAYERQADDLGEN